MALTAGTGGRRNTAGSRARAGLAFALLGVLLCMTPGHSQSSTGQGNGQANQQPVFPTGRQSMGGVPIDDGYDMAVSERRLNALNTERQKQLVADTNKLVKLAQELHDEIAVANTGAWTPDQMRKIAEIEKLAKNVKERMTTGVGNPSAVMPTPSVIYPAH